MTIHAKHAPRLFIAFLMLVVWPMHSWAQAAVGEAETRLTQGVISDQIAAFKSGDSERAYSHAAPNVKIVFPTADRFIAMVQTGYTPLYNPDSFVFGRNALIGEQIHQELIVTDHAGKQWQAVYSLQLQGDGSWRITGVKLNPYSGASA